MSGVVRPYTLADVLGALSDQIGATTSTTTVQSLGQFVEDDESVTSAEVTPTLTVAANAGWDQGVWGGFGWN